ncbi:MAG: STAS domain-containing protein, partial [Planctomycetota bacterium]|nr:STAS domain-containing protein [Planctomycetota bacterium]
REVDRFWPALSQAGGAAMKTLQIRTERPAAGEAVVYLAGALDADTRAALSEEFERLMDEEVKAFTLDLADLEYLASAGAGAIIAAMLTVQEAGGSMRFINLNSRVQYVFTNMGIPLDSARI